MVVMSAVMCDSEAASPTQPALVLIPGGRGTVVGWDSHTGPISARNSQLHGREAMGFLGDSLQDFLQTRPGHRPQLQANGRIQIVQVPGVGSLLALGDLS